MQGVARRAADRAAGVAGSEGFSLVESMVAMSIMAMVLLGIAQLIGAGIQLEQASEDVTAATALAEDKLEELKNVDFNALAAGGSVNLDQPGFFDTADPDNDGRVDYTRRWQVIDLGPGKITQVRVISNLATLGPAKEAQITALISR